MLPMTTREYFTERRDFLYIAAVPSPSGNGYDVVLRLDGTYFDRELAFEVAEWMRRTLRFTDLPTTQWHSWLLPERWAARKSRTPRD